MSIVHLNTDKPTELSFDVDIKSEMDGAEKTKIRFVVLDVHNQYDISFPCEQDGNKWTVTIPNIDGIDGNKFRLEVIVDEFYYEPVRGTVTSKQEKPTVKVNESVVEGAATSGGPDVTDDSAPTNDLLDTEFPAASNEKSSLIHRPEDEDTDETELDGSVNVAEQIIHTIVGKKRVVEKSGFLFKRDGDGHIMVPGLHKVALSKQATEKSKRVKDILKKL